MALSDLIVADLKLAMKAKDEVTKQTLRMLKTELSKKEADLGRELDETEELGVLTSAVKSRRDSIAAYEEAGRQDLADAEQAEIAVLERYLPAQMSDEEARAAIEAIAAELSVTSKKDMGRLMKVVLERHRGQIEGKTASRIAGSILS